jgi:radical SAM protein with 4Fe4S-binding SPASM domain
MASDAERGGPRRLEIELTPVCDHRCVHCYNVWNARPGDAQHGLAPRVERDLGQVRALIDRVAEQGVEHLSLTGGEPLLHPEALAIVEHACAKVSSVSLITNGSHVSDAVAQRLGEAGLRSAQLTLLGGRREVHDPLKGVESFDDTLRSALRLRDAGVRVNACFVASQRNAGQLPGVLELCFALGIRSLSYNRMSAAGLGVHRIAALLPSPEQIEADLRACETLARRWEIRVSTAMPIPPCLVRWERYPWVRFGVCSSGSGQHNLVMDLEGRLRACNLCHRVLGSVWEHPLEELAAGPYLDRFRASLPPMCRGCPHARSCAGGCKESAFAAFGSLEAPDPLVWLALSPEERARLELPELPAQEGLDG